MFTISKQVNFLDENTSCIFIPREQKCEEAYKDLHPYVTHSFLAIYPKTHQALICILVFKEGLGEKCLRGTSDVLHIVPIFKKILSLRHGVECPT